MDALSVKNSTRRAGPCVSGLEGEPEERACPACPDLSRPGQELLGDSVGGAIPPISPFKLRWTSTFFGELVAPDIRDCLFCDRHLGSPSWQAGSRLCRLLRPAGTCQRTLHLAHQPHPR